MTVSRPSVVLRPAALEAGGDLGGVHRCLGVVQGFDENHCAHERSVQGGADPAAELMSSLMSSACG
ncbi:hypothetical protein ACFWIO_00535 [Streptomyces diastatochromogenes]|uniref:hypothetical protein n=1 Tax=Streptomyces diastatochromogenes TaxID=42236 RepID=UPI0036676FD2